MYNGQEAVIIRCSDVGWPLKSELALTGTVCLSDGAVWQLFSYCGFHWIPLKRTRRVKIQRPISAANLCFSLLRSLFQKARSLCFLIMTLNNSQTGNSHFRIYYVTMVENWRKAYFLNLHNSHTHSDTKYEDRSYMDVILTGFLCKS